MLRTQKSLVSDVAAAKILVTEMFKKSNFFKLLAAELPAARTSKKLSFFRLTPGAGGLKNASDFYVFYDLMYTLAAQIELVSNLAEGVSSRAHLQNLCVSRRIRRRTRLEWSPLPTRNSLDCRGAFFRKLVFSTTLPHVSDPSAKSYFFSINSFNMNCWNITMPFAHRKLLQGSDVYIEACSVVHIHNSIRGPLSYVDGSETVLHPLEILGIKEIL